MAKGWYSPTSPFNIFGALATTGAQGARGAYEGIFGGEEARRRFLAEDEANRIRALQAILLGKQVDQFGQPTYSFHGDRQVMQVPGKAPVVTELPQTEAEKRLAEERAAQARKADRESAPTEAQAKGKIITEYLQRLQTDGPLKAKEWLDQTLATIHAAESKGAAGSKGFTLPRGAIRFDESGKEIARGAPVPPRAGLSDRTTTTQGYRIIPGHEIVNTDELAKIREALPQVVNEIAGSPNIKGWMDKGPTVRVEGYAAPVRREDVIKHALLRRAGIEAEVRWDGRNWVLVRAKIPTTKEKTEQTRTTGPARQSSKDDDEED